MGGRCERERESVVVRCFLNKKSVLEEFANEIIDLQFVIQTDSTFCIFIIGIRGSYSS